MNQIAISVIIPTYHRNQQLAECLERLAPGRQTLSAQEYEVIVSDDGKETTAKGMIKERYPWVKWVAGSCQGPAANRNNGAQFARGKWLAFTDDDCLPDPQWLSAFLAASQGNCLALEGAIYPLGDPNLDLTECPVNLTGGCFWSANIAIERSLFLRLGGFDPNYPLAIHEDVDLKERLLAFTNIAFVPEARVFHPARRLSFSAIIARIPGRAAATAYHLQKHQKVYGCNTALDLAWFQFKYYLGCFFKDAIAGKFKFALVALANLLWGVPLTWLHLRRWRAKQF